MFCKRCGAELAEDAKFCTSCGESIKSASEDLKAFVGKNWEYYNRKWENVDSRYGGGWNWAALFLPPFWLGYRKMYSTFPGIMFYIMACLFVPVLIISGQFGYIRSVIMFFIILGLGGNKLYYRHAKKKIAKIKKRQDVGDVCLRISKAGGTSKWGVWIAAVFTAIISIAYALLVFVNLG